MVTAIVIPILCFYFYWMTKKEMKEQDRKWLQVGQFEEEAIVTGIIKSIHNEKQKYYYHRYIYVQEFKVQTETKTIIMKKETPLTRKISIEQYDNGEVIRAFGQWQDHQFFCRRIEKVKNKNMDH